MKNWKSISATLLAAALVTSTAGQAWANETEKVDASTFETVNLQDALENVKDETATGKDLEVISSIIPVGYLANNIFALSNNLEKISNPKAKEALRKNIEKAIARWAAKDKAEVEPVNETLENDVTATPEEDVSPVTDSEEETPVTVLPENEKHDVKMNKEEKKALKKAEKEEKKALKKAERLARDEAKKTAKLAKHEVKRVKKEEHKANKDSKKEERHDKHDAKHEGKGKKGRD